MTVIVLTDMHGRYTFPPSFRERMRRSDAVFLGGDITHFGVPGDAVPFLTELRRYNSAILGVAGNCDAPEMERYLEAEGIGVHSRCTMLGDVSVLGVGGSLPAPVFTPHTFSEEEYTRILETAMGRRDSGPDIIISHQPPFRTKLDRVTGFRHVGSRVLREFIEKTAPKLVFCGHIHESSGVDTLGTATLVNPGPFREGRYGVVTLERGEVTVELQTL